MSDPVVALLEKRGPMLSSEVAAELVSSLGLLPAAARQRVSRANDSVRSIPISFRHNARFIYLSKQYGSSAFWSSLVNRLRTSNGAYSRALESLLQRGGIMPISHFGIASAAPLRQSKQLSPDLVRTHLVDAGLLEELNVPGIGPCLAFAKTTAYLDELVPSMKARLISENVLLGAIRNWARNLNLGSYDKFQLRDTGTAQPQVAGFEWDVTSPSYLAPLTQMKPGGKPKPGFVLFDLLLSEDMLTKEGVGPFLHKCSMVRSLPNIGRCLPFFVADTYTLEAMRLLRHHGIIPATPASLFGEEVAEALRELLKTLTHAARTVVDPVKFAALFDKLQSIEGAAASLRGALFEFVVADIVRREFNASVTMNRILRAGGKDAAEIDVLGVVENRTAYFIECKGNAPGVSVSDEEIERWLHTRIPTVRKWALSHDDLKRLRHRFELWTSGILSTESRALIAKAISETKATKYDIVVREMAEIETITEKIRNKSLVKVLRDHFSRNQFT